MRVGSAVERDRSHMLDVAEITDVKDLDSLEAGAGGRRGCAFSAGGIPALALGRAPVGPLRGVHRAEHKAAPDADVSLGADAREERAFPGVPRRPHVDDPEAIVATLDGRLPPERQV